MSTVLIVDDAIAVTELFARAVEEQTTHRVIVLHALEDVAPALATIDPPALALVDLSFPQQDGSGLDALVDIHRISPTTKLAIITQGDEWVAELLRDAYDLLPICTVISKSAPLAYQVTAIEQALRTGSAPVDPAIQPLLPASSRGRRPESFALLVQHAGHAKLWRALWETNATYKELAVVSGLKLNTLKNYRAQLVQELRTHGLDDPTLKEMQAFAIRCRPFLAPYVERFTPGAAPERS
jgi:DNA-binding NarL/FixJ family response regulator